MKKKAIIFFTPTIFLTVSYTLAMQNKIISIPQITDQQEMILLGNTVTMAKNYTEEQSNIAGIPPLHQAIANKNQEHVQQLLAGNTDPNSTDDHQFTSLHLATFLKHQEMLKMLLLQPKIDPNTADNNGYTPLHIATLENDTISAIILYQNGANPHIANANGKTPLTIAEETGPEIASILKKNRFFSLLKRKITILFSRSNNQGIFSRLWTKFLHYFSTLKRGK